MPKYTQNTSQTSPQTPPTSNLKKTEKGKNELKNKLSEVVFPNFWPLDAGILNFWPKIRILREISSPEPAGKV